MDPTVPDGRDQKLGGARAGVDSASNHPDEAFERFVQGQLTVADHSPVPLVYLDRDERYRYANKAYLEKFGVTWEAIKGRSLRDVVGPENYSLMSPRLARSMEGGPIKFELAAPYTKELRLGRRYIEISYSPHFDEHGNAVGVVTSIVDTTDLKLAERGQKLQHAVTRILADETLLSDAAPLFLELMASELECEVGSLWRLDLAVNALRCVETWSAPGDQFATFSENSSKINFSRDVALPGKVWATGQPLWIADLAQQPDLLRAEHFAPAGLRSALAFPIVDRQVVIGALEFVGRNVLPVNDGLLALLQALGQQIGQFMARLRVVEQLQQSHKLEAVGRLAGGIAHDFNNLLTVVTGNCELALETLEPDTMMRETLTEIADAGKRAATLTARLLALSRKQMIRYTTVDLKAVVEALSPRLDLEAGQSIDLVVKSDPDLGLIRSDPDQLEQILSNLLSNARDAMPGGGTVTIELANVTLDEAHARELIGATPGPYVLLAVSDTGRGMDRRTSSRIFDPFFTTKDETKGGGLGLSVVYAIIKQSGGHMWVYSEPGRGTTLKTYFPRVHEPGAPQAAVAPDTRQLNGTETILLVDDDERLRKLTAKLLRSRGYTVVEASDGAEALAICAQDRSLDMILSDVMMPGIRGPELIQKLKSLRPTLKVMLMSGYTADAIDQLGIDSSGVVFLSKPFSVVELAAKVRQVLDPGTT
jgi:two-component system cell cycle sensor histidine kinase/response regulator CckA